MISFVYQSINSNKIENIPCELYVPGLQSKYRREKCTKTRSRSCVSPFNENCCKNCRSASSNVKFSKLKYFKYSSATARLKSLLMEIEKNYRIKSNFQTNDK